MGRQTGVALVVVLTIAIACANGCAKNVVNRQAGTNNAQPNSPVHLASLFFGPSHPPARTGKVGDFFLDVYDSLLYGPKTISGWGTPLQLPAEVGAGQYQMLTGSGVPGSGLGNIGDYYLDLAHDDLFGPKTIAGWVNTITLGGDTSAAPGNPSNPSPPPPN